MGSFSWAHIDAGGFNTFIQMKQGVKIWWVARPKRDALRNIIPIQMNLTELEVEKYDWVRYVLEPSQIL